MLVVSDLTPHPVALPGFAGALRLRSDSAGGRGNRQILEGQAIGRIRRADTDL